MRLTPQLTMCDAERVFFPFPQQDEDADDEMNQYTYNTKCSVRHKEMNVIC